VPYNRLYGIEFDGWYFPVTGLQADSQTAYRRGYRVIKSI
jgi:hypothetical protein